MFNIFKRVFKRKKKRWIEYHPVWFRLWSLTEKGMNRTKNNRKWTKKKRRTFPLSMTHQIFVLGFILFAFRRPIQWRSPRLKTSVVFFLFATDIHWVYVYHTEPPCLPFRSNQSGWLRAKFLLVLIFEIWVWHLLLCKRFSLIGCCYREQLRSDTVCAW